MQTFLLSFIAFALAVALMALGALLAGKRILGSCGGLSAFRGPDGKPVCDACAECPDRTPECELRSRGRGAEAPTA